MPSDITISMSRFLELIKAQNMLKCLESAGVDNWDGYHYAYVEHLKEFPNEDT